MIDRRYASLVPALLEWMLLESERYSNKKRLDKLLRSSRDGAQSNPRAVAEGGWAGARRDGLEPDRRRNDPENVDLTIRLLWKCLF